MNKLSRYWGHWKSLCHADRVDFLIIVTQVPLVLLSLKLLGMRPLIQWAHKPVSRARVISTPELASKVSLVYKACYFCLPSGGCLPRSLILCRKLRNRGLQAKIHIGVKANVKPLIAHAWVELEGQPLEQETEQYRHFTTAFTQP